MCVICVAAATLPFLLGAPLADGLHQEMRTLPAPADAMSAHIEPADALSAVRYQEPNGTWSAWEPLLVEREQDPNTFESNLVVFPKSEEKIELRTNAKVVTLHPITVSHAPTSTIQAARIPVSTAGEYRIITREEWGADPLILVRSGSSSSSDTGGDIGDTTGSATPTERERECADHVKNYPNEFKTISTVTTDAQGRTLRWPQKQMSEVKMLVVHHTAMTIDGDSRPAVERMRALYQYHAQNRGWGDVGYHYIIDEKGQIYEGHAGGPHVVGGHAYCNNVGTLGIAMMGNFEESAPPQEQVMALQWLLKTLADREHLDLNRDVMFHGKIYPVIVGHRDVLSTSCPGFYLYGVMQQVRDHVRAGMINAEVTFPIKPKAKEAPYIDRSAERRAKREQAAGNMTTTKVGLSTIGATTLQGRPGEQVLVSLHYQAGDKILTEGATLAQIQRSSDVVGLWVDRNGSFQRLRDELPSPVRINSGEAINIRLRIQFPMDAAHESLSIGSVTYQLESEGRRVRSRDQAPVPQTYTRPERTSSLPAVAPGAQAGTSSIASIPSRSSLSPQPSTNNSAPSSSTGDRTIRIRLTLDRSGTILDRITLNVPSGTTAGSLSVNDSVTLKQNGTSCQMDAATGTLSQGILRLDPGTQMISFSDAQGERHYKGILECRIVNNQLTLIDELPLETYMEGVSEEPDTEPVEKQKAFAVAARSYVEYYRSPDHRKFPGKPYDGSDDAATFQKYSGVNSNAKYEQWVNSVHATSGMVITKSGDVLKIPYFTSDDGRTRSPSEVGWSGFPYAEVFSSKDDHWCAGLPLNGHGVGMSGCGAKAQALEGKTWKEILGYYFLGTVIETLQ